MNSVHLTCASRIAAIAALSLMPWMLASAASLASGPAVNPSNGHTYFLLSADTWTASESFAQSMGGHLVTVNDAAENDWISDTFTSGGTINRAIWIGLNDSAHEGSWEWASGEPVTYLGWDAGQPNSGFGMWDEDFAHFWGTTGYGGTRYRWNDYLDGSSLDGKAPLQGVIELLASPVPEPAPVALFAIAAFFAMAKRWRGL